MEPDETKRLLEDAEEGAAAFRCPYCQGRTREDVVQAALWLERGLIAIEEIPARVCQQCGEQFYAEEVTRKIERLIEDPSAQATRQILVPVFSLAEVEARPR
jgi:YgiT-type zinc finger domain-containing protein